MRSLIFNRIRKTFGKHVVLSDVSFSLEGGEIFGLVGKSGGGKSVFLKILVGILKRDSGTIYVDGIRVRGSKWLRRLIGYASQDNLLLDELSIKENAFYYGKLYGMRSRDIRSRMNEMLDFLDLVGVENKYVSSLSGGMKKRANLLISLIHNPQILILDEPAVGLDSILRTSFWRYIHEINRRGTTIIVTSHLLDELEENCSSIGILKEGSIVAFAKVSKYKEIYGEEVSLKQIFEGIINDGTI